MSSFVLYVIIVTLVWICYYCFMIWLDLKKLGKQPTSTQEEFDVSSMKGEEEVCQVDESDYLLPETKVEKPKDEGESEDSQPVQKPDKPSEAEKQIKAINEKLEPVDAQTGVQHAVDELDEIMRKGDLWGPKFKKKKK